MVTQDKAGGKRPRKLTPHQKIIRAANNLTGLRLTASEVFALSRDHAIWQAAQNDDETAGLRGPMGGRE